MLEIGHISSLYAQFLVLIVASKKTAVLKKIRAQDYAAITFYISNSKRNKDYVVRLFDI